MSPDYVERVEAMKAAVDEQIRAQQEAISISIAVMRAQIDAERTRLQGEAGVRQDFLRGAIEVDEFERRIGLVLELEKGLG